MKWPWVSQALYRNILRQLAAERRRAEGLSTALELERHENRLAERHWANQFLRKMNAYPQTAEVKKGDGKPYVAPVRYDAGELAAVVEEAKRLGVNEKDAKEYFAREKGIDASKLTTH